MTKKVEASTVYGTMNQGERAAFLEEAKRWWLKNHPEYSPDYVVVTTNKRYLVITRYHVLARVLYKKRRVYVCYKRIKEGRLTNGTSI